MRQARSLNRQCFPKLPRMTVLLEAVTGDHLIAAVATGVAVFLLLMVIVTILVGFGSGRPHTRSK